MRHVLTFIAGSPDLVDLGATVTRLTASYSGMPIRWLAPGIACDVELEYKLPTPVWETLRAACHAKHVDVVMQPLSQREKKLLISDMDSTLIEQECIDELAECVGARAQVSAITARAMNGELDFTAALRERVALLQGLDEATLQRVYDERITLMPGAKTLVATMKSRGAYTVLVSGGFTFFTSRVAKALGMDASHANRLALAKHTSSLLAGQLSYKMTRQFSVLTGKVIEPVLGRAEKREALLRYALAQNVPLASTLAVGDGANDLPMILAAGLGIAYHAKPTVVAQAKAAIHFNDLSALLYVQGIPRSEWKTPD